MDPSVLTVYNSPFSKLRLGKEYDGGYIIADIPNVTYNIQLSGGIENDISFEEGFISKYPNVKTYSFDGTINHLPKENNNLQIGNNSNNLNIQQSLNNSNDSNNINNSNDNNSNNSNYRSLNLILLILLSLLTLYLIFYYIKNRIV
jgi:ATP-dependent Zn protease